MTDSPAARPIWIDESEVAKLPGWLWDRYRKSPADSTEAAWEAALSDPQFFCSDKAAFTRAVLAALGWKP